MSTAIVSPFYYLLTAVTLAAVWSRAPDYTLFFNGNNDYAIIVEAGAEHPTPGGRKIRLKIHRSDFH